MLRICSAIIALTVFASVLQAQPPKVAPKPEEDSFAELVQKLHSKKVKFPNSLKDTPLRTIKEQLEKDFDIKIVVREDLFKRQGEPDDIMDRKFKIDTNLSGVPLEAFLRLALQDVGATFLVRKHYVEITTWESAVAYANGPDLEPLKGDSLRDFIRDTPLVCAVIKEKTAEQAIAELAETYGFTVIVAAQAAEDVKTKISARLMNVPFPTALDVLALNAGLRVIRRENTFIVTTVEHAGNLKAKAVKPVKK